MKGLRIATTLLLMILVLSASIGVGPVEAATKPSAQSVDFVRHNYATEPWGTGGESAMERRMRNADFIRHNVGTRSWAKLDADTGAEAMLELRTRHADVGTKTTATYKRRTQNVEFLRHNRGTKPWVAQQDATPSDPQRVDHRKNKR